RFWNSCFAVAAMGILLLEIPGRIVQIEHFKMAWAPFIEGEHAATFGVLAFAKRNPAVAAHGHRMPGRQPVVAVGFAEINADLLGNAKLRMDGKPERIWEPVFEQARPGIAALYHAIRNQPRDFLNRRPA